MEGRLVRHLNEIDDTVNKKMEILVRQMIQCEGITEDMKSEEKK